MGGLAPADVWRIIRRRLWLIIACFVVIGLGGSGAIIAWWYLAPSYTASGGVEVEPGQGQMPTVLGFTEAGAPAVQFELYVQSQVLAILNDRVLNAALEKLKNEQTTYVGASAAYSLGRDLQVSYIPNTQDINVSLRGRKKEQVQAIVREVLTAYTEQIKTDRADTDRERQQELRLERDDLRNQLNDLARKLASYREETSVVVTDERGGEQMARLTTLARQHADMQLQLAEANSNWTQFQDLRRQAEEGKDLTPVLMAFPEIMDALRRDPSVSSLNEQVSRAAQDIQILKQRFGDKHEMVVRAQTNFQSAQNEVQTKQQEVLGQLFQQEAAVLKAKYERTRSAEAELLARVAEARQAAVASAKLTADYRAREEEYLRVQALLNTVTDGLERMRISSALARPNIRVKRWPVIPIEPSEPRLPLFIPGAVLFSLLLGLALALLLEVMDTRLRTPTEVVRQVAVPLLGAIPDLTEDERLALDTPLATVSQAMPHSLIAESFRQFRTVLRFASDRPIKSVLITSPNPGDGKSSVAANLAITMARGGLRVLLIEANFRRPCLAHYFDVPDGIGLSNVVVGVAKFEEAVQSTRIENLDVLPCGMLPPSPAELLGSPRMRELISDLSKRYDTVIIDAAPMLVVGDNHLLVEAVDGVVMVLQAGESTRGVAQRAVRQVVTMRARLLGAVLNRVRATKGGYFREAYQAYYDYAGPARPTEPLPVAGGQPPPAAMGAPEAQPALSPETDKSSPGAVLSEEDPGAVLSEEDPGGVLGEEDPGGVLGEEDPGGVLGEEDPGGGETPSADPPKV
jgi:capsular exopolysaccharide synthesis family protein